MTGQARRLTRTVWALGAVSLFTDLASDMVYPVLPAFLVGTLGASALALGFIEGVAEATAAFFKLVSGRLSDRVRRRKPLVLAGYGLSGLVKPALALASAPWHVLAVRFADRAGKGVRSAPRDALLAAHAGEAGRGSVFGLHRSMDTVGAVLGPLVAALVLALAPGRYRLLFLLTLVPGVLALAFVVWGVRERRPGVGEGAGSAAPPGGSPPPATPPDPDPLGPVPARELLQARGFPRLLVLVLIFSLGNSSEAFLLLRAENLGTATAALPLLWMVLNVVYAATAWWAGSWSDRVGRGRVLGVGFGLYALTYLMLATAEGGAVTWGIFGLYGLYFGLTDGVLRAAVADAAPPALRGTAFGVYHALTGVALLVASVLAGWLWDAVGPEAPFVLGAATGVLAAVLSVWWLPARR